MRRLCVVLGTLAALSAGCGGGTTSDGACEPANPQCVDEDVVDVATVPPAPSS
jgi:hypothetical protein